MTDRELMQQALDALEIVTHHFTRTPSTLKDSEARGEAHAAITALRERLARQEQPEQEPVAKVIEEIEAEFKKSIQKMQDDIQNKLLAQPDAYGYASRLATHIWQKHYIKDAPQWTPFGDLVGVLTQIDNMTAGLTRLAQPEQEPLAWVYPEGLEALKAGKPWTAYGTRQEPNNTALYLSPQPDTAPYAWVTFTPYGDEDDVWYENPEGKLLEGWTYKPLYDTTPPQRTWVGLTEDEIVQIGVATGLNRVAVGMIETKLKEKNT